VRLPETPARARSLLNTALMRRPLFIAAALLPIACGGSVTGESAGTPDSGVSGLVTCSANGRPLSVSVAFFRGGTPGANGSVTAAVTAVTGDTIDLDACHPAADCVPMLIRVSLGNKDVSLASVVPVGAFVKLDWDQSPTGWAGDNWRVVVSSVATWGGMNNPAGSGDAFLFAANSGREDPLPTAPFTLVKSPLDCPATEGTSSCAYAKVYAYEVTVPAMPKTKVGMAQRAELGSVVFENFEAWDSKCTDDYWHWSWLATRKAR